MRRWVRRLLGIHSPSLHMLGLCDQGCPRYPKTKED